MKEIRYTPARITFLNDNEVFVFGSNLDGMHGGGAARMAYESFGAVWGEGVGHFGKTYAIPTMHGGIEAVAPLFKGCIDMDNVVLPESFHV